MARGPIPSFKPWKPPAARVEGDRLLQLQQLRQKAASAEAKAKQADARADVAVKEARQADREIDSVRDAVKKLRDDLPHIVPGSGGGRRSVKKVLDRYGAEYLDDLGVMVKLTGDQTIAGIKTFSSAPVVPDASWSIAKTSGLQAALDAKQDMALADKVTAGTKAVPTGTAWVYTNAYDATDHPTKGGARYRQSTLSEVTGVDSRFWFETTNGRYFIIDTAQKITLTMAGGAGDLTYELQSGLNAGGGDGNGNTSTEGFIRTAGTNDRTAMLALDAFCAARNITAHIDADHYISGQTKLTARWMGVHGEYQFVNTLWIEYFETYDGTIDTISNEIEVGFWFENPEPHAGLFDVYVIGQWNSSGTSKPAVCVPDMPILGQGGGLGHRGSIIHMGEQYYTTEPTPIVDCSLRVMIMRAGRKTSTNHHSANNLMIAISGYVEHSTFEIGLFGKTNTTNTWVILLPYGVQYDPSLNGFAPYDAYIPNKTQSTITASYHPAYITIKFLTDIDNTVTFANVGKPWELNGCGPSRVHGYYAKGVACGAGTVSCGDYTDYYATERQKGIINRGIHIGFIKADKCYQNSAISEFSKGGFLVKGAGTISGRTELYDGTELNGTTPDVTTLTTVSPQLQWTGNLGIQKSRMQIFDVKCDGFDLEVLNSEHEPVTGDGVTGITVLCGLGRLNLGNVTLRGDCRRGIEVEHFNGDFQVESYDGVGVLSHEFSKGGRYRNINNDRGTAVELVFTSGGTTEVEVGDTLTGLTSGAIGVVSKVHVISGTWAAGTAAGDFEVEITSGIFAAENVSTGGGGGSNDATVAAASTGAYKPGFGGASNPTQNVAIQVAGTTFTAGVLDGDVTAGATKIPLVDYLPTQVYTGDYIRVGTVWTVATETISEPVTASVAHSGGPTTVDFGGVKYLTVEPLVAGVTSGATVTVDQRSHIHELTAGFRNSQYGMTVNDSIVKNCDIGDVRGTGQYAAWLSNGAYVEFVGSLPATVGRAGVTDATVRVEDSDTFAIFRGTDIPYNPNVSAQVQLPSAAGRIVFDGARIENVTSLHSLGEGTWDRVRMSNSFDYAGNALRNGPYTVTPVVQTGGVATGIPVSVNASRITIDDAANVSLTIEVTLGTVAAPTAGSLTVVNDGGGTDWPAPTSATSGTLVVITNGASLPEGLSCEIGTNKTITLYSQGTTGRTALTEANIATGMQFRCRLVYVRAAT